MNLLRLALVLSFLPACAATSPIVHDAWTGEIARPAAPVAEGAAIAPAPLARAQDAAAAVEDFRLIAVHAGVRQFDEDDWEPLEEQTALALEFVSQNAGAVAGFEAGLSYSSEDDDLDAGGGLVLDLEVEVWELYAGVHKSFLDAGPVRPFLGAGLTYLMADLEASAGGASTDDDDEVFGFYVHGGVGAQLTEQLEVGADLRAILADDFDVLGVDADSDYVQATVFLGFRI